MQQLDYLDAMEVWIVPRLRVLSILQAFTGNINDKSICSNDLFTLTVKHGSLQHVTYELWNSYGKKYKCQGGYLIVDGEFKSIHVRTVYLTFH